MSGTSGTPRTVSYFLTTDFQDGQPSGSIVPQYMRDLVVSINTGSVLGPPIAGVRIVTDYATTQLVTDQVIIINTPVALWGPIVSVNLIPVTVAGTLLTIKDGVGGANSSPIVIVAPNAVTIDGSSTLTLSIQFQSVQLCWNGTQWNVLNQYVPSNQDQIQGQFGAGIGPGTTSQADFTHPLDYYDYDVGLPFVLKVTAHSVTTGQAYSACFTVLIHIENFVGELIQSPAYSEINTPGEIAFGGGVLSLQWINVVTNGSSFSLLITNTSTTETFVMWAGISDIN